MIQKKSPRGLAAVGAGKKGGKVVNLACPHSATPALPAQGESCDRCQFFRIVALASGHDRKLCMMTGESSVPPPAGVTCSRPASGKRPGPILHRPPVKAGSAVSVGMASCRPSGPPSSALWDAVPITCRTVAAGLSSAPASR